MRNTRLLLLLSIAAAGSAGAQPPPSPFDTNPKCTQRNTAPDDPECVIPQEGTPRHTYPPPRKTAPTQPPPTQPTKPSAQQKDIKSPGGSGQLR